MSATSAFRIDGGGPRYFGVYPAIVTDLVDPDKLGRIELKFPWLGTAGENVRAWSTLLSPYADKDQGFQVLPEVDSQVVVAFEAGSLERPYIVGACWNGVAAMPESAAAPNNKRVIKTRSGSILEFDDTEGTPKITLQTNGGHKLVLDDGAMEVTLQHSNGCLIKMNAGGQVQITANSTVEVKASAVNVHAPTATFDGMINCQTLNASVSVTSPSYSIGAGNMW